MGVAHLAGQEYVQAEQVFRRALVLSIPHASLHIRLGLALGAQGKLDEAVAALRAAASKAPAEPDVHLNLGTVHEQQRRLEEAAACYRRTRFLLLQPERQDLA